MTVNFSKRLVISLFAVAAALLALLVLYVYDDRQFRKPLMNAEIDSFAALIAGRNCDWEYQDTREGSRLRARYSAQWRVDASVPAKFLVAKRKYEGLTPDEQCKLLDQFPNLVRRVNR